MRKIIVSEFITLDGVMEGPGKADGFRSAASVEVLNHIIARNLNLAHSSIG